MKVSVANHAWLTIPGLREIGLWAERRKLSEEAALVELLEQRKRAIEEEERDPFRYGYDSPVWHVGDALLGMDCRDGLFLEDVKRRTGLGWKAFAERFRTALGFEQPVKMLLVMGANRSGKSEFAAKRGVECAVGRANGNVAAFHMSAPRSIRDQQPLFYKYLPHEWRRQVTGELEYMKYKRHTGFSGGSFITPNGSAVSFSNYSQDRDTALEGMEPDLLLPDELVPPDWLETMLFRLATRAGVAIVTFTPVNGYTPSVKLFCDGGTVTRWTTGYMLPKDGGPPDIGRTLGMTPEQWAVFQADRKKKLASRVPWSWPEDVIEWVTDPGAEDRRAAATGRVWERVPRVMRSANRRLAVVWFHGRDNPYGNPVEVCESAVSKGTSFVRQRVYGIADKSVSAIFTRFSRDVHVVKDADVPLGGRRVQVIDPAGDRNWFMIWALLAQGRWWVYREWPGSYWIPGIGVPEPWAVPSGKREGRNDGQRAEGQESFGFGLLRYKFEIARLEGWEAFERWRGSEVGGQRSEGGGRRTEDRGQTADNRQQTAEMGSGQIGEDAFPWDEIEDWDERQGARERLFGRVVDSRAASSPRLENDRPVTLYEDLLAAGLDMTLATGVEIETGLSKITEGLDYGPEHAPKLVVAESCRNVIYALENWMNVDGDRGACRDPIDCLRYLLTQDDDPWRMDGGVVVRSGPAFGRGAAVRKGRDDGRVDLSRFKGEAGARAGFHRAVWGRR
jgi:hypothetical protein